MFSLFTLTKYSATILLSYLPNPSARAGYDTRSIFKRRLTDLNSEYSFSLTSCLTKAEEPSLSYYLPIAGGRIIGFISFPEVLVLREMQSVSSRVWTHVAVSISYDDNHYTTGNNFIIIIFSLRVFHISFSWWSFTGVWVTASLLKSPGLFSVFWQFTIML